MKTLSAVRAGALFVCFVGILPTEILQAQQPVGVAPEVKTDVLRRLEFARTWIMPQQRTYPGKNEKGYRSICNSGAHPNKLPYTQTESCKELAFGSQYSNPSIDDLLPGFKACSIDATKESCWDLLFQLVQYGKGDYAVALIESGVLGKDPYGQIKITMQKQPLQLSLAFLERQGYMSIAVSQSLDVANVLKSLCLVSRADDPNPCNFYRQFGGIIDQAQREVTAQRTERAEDASLERSKNVQAGYNNHTNDVLHALGGTADALQSTETTIQETAAQQQENLQAMAASAQQRQQTQARTASENPQPTPNTVTVPPTNSCRNMTSCLKINATFDAGGVSERVFVTNTCTQTIRATVSVYPQGRSCTQSQTTNLQPGETQNMGAETPRNWYAAQADDSIYSGKTGEGCKLVIPTECNP
jgi:hypothetical protein